MKRDEAIKLASKGFEELEEALKQGRSEILERYLAVMARFHDYSFHNCLMILFQCPGATRVAGFRKWQDFGRHVRKGEKGIAIFAPMIHRQKDERQESDQDNLEVHAVQGFRVVHVFDVSQTEGDPLPEFAQVTGHPGEWLTRLAHVASSRGIQIEYVDSLGGANGCSSGGTISVLDSLPPGEKFLTLVHELAHEELHRGNRRAGTTKKVRETEAEAVGFVVARAVGIECTVHSADYIQLYRGDAESLRESMHLVQKTAADLIEALQNTRLPCEAAQCRG